MATTSTSGVVVAGLPPLLSSSPLSAPALDAALEAQRSSARLVVSDSLVEVMRGAGCREEARVGREREATTLSLSSLIGEIHAVENQNENQHLTRVHAR